MDTYPVEYEGFSEDITIKSITIDAQIFMPDSNVDYDSADAHTIKNNLHDIKLKLSYVMNEYNSDHSAKDPYYTFSLDITDLLAQDAEIDGARMTVYPNDFTNGTMEALINKNALIPYKKGLSVTIEKEEEETQSQAEP